jgi:3'-5' exoribonuclease
MKASFVNQLEPGQTITSSFLVHTKEIREKKTGEPYLSLLLSDKTGRIDAKMWDNVAEVLEAFDRDDFVKIKAIVQLHQNRPQLTIHKVRAMDDGEVDFADYFPCSPRDPEEMWRCLESFVGAVRDAHIRALLAEFLRDPEIAARYRRAPAAKTIHHAYLGGLLEHVLSLCNLSRSIAPLYPHIDLDLLIAGAILHDIGKIHELTFERGFSYTTEGQLLGHIPIAFRMIADKLRALPDFPPRVRTLIEHIVLSHHGSLEFGSPRVPQFPEAMLFHYLDDLDSKMECMRASVEQDRHSTGFFTSFVPSLDRPLLKKDFFLDLSSSALSMSAPLASPPPAAATLVAVPVATSVPEPAAHPKPAPPVPVPPQARPEPARPIISERPSGLFGSKLVEALHPLPGKPLPAPAKHE